MRTAGEYRTGAARVPGTYLALAGLSTAVGLLMVSAAAAATPLSKMEYQKRMQSIGQAYAREKAGVIKDAGSDNMQRFILQDEQLATVYRHLVTRLSAVVPPPRAAQDHRVLIQTFHVFANLLSASAAAAKRGDKTQAFQLQDRVLTDPAARRGQQAEADLKAKGYKLGIFTQYA